MHDVEKARWRDWCWRKSEKERLRKGERETDSDRERGRKGERREGLKRES